MIDQYINALQASVKELSDAASMEADLCTLLTTKEGLTTLLYIFRLRRYVKKLGKISRRLSCFL